MNKSFSLYVDMHIVWSDITVLGEVIHDNGGKLFLAHPYKYSKEVNIEEMLNSCRTYIDGIEVSNESENAEQVNYLYDYAIRNNLLISAGSDFHGSKGHNNLMVNYLSEEMEDRIEDWIPTVPGKVKILKK